MDPNFADLNVPVELLPCAVRAATATGDAVDLKDYDGPLEVILSSAAASSGDTLDAKLQDSADGSTGWADISGGAFTQVTASAAAFESKKINSDSIKRYIRAVGTIAGNGSEAIAFAVILCGQKVRG